MPQLTQSRIQQLDGIVQRMLDEGRTDDEIQFVVNDFKSLYEGEEEPVSPPIDFGDSPLLEDTSLPESEQIEVPFEEENPIEEPKPLEEEPTKIEEPVEMSASAKASKDYINTYIRPVPGFSWVVVDPNTGTPALDIPDFDLSFLKSKKAIDDDPTTTTAVESLARTWNNSLNQLSLTDDRFNALSEQLFGSMESINYNRAKVAIDKADKESARAGETLRLEDVPSAFKDQGFTGGLAHTSAAVVDAVSAVGTSFIQNASTAGGALISDMLQNSVQSYTQERADELGVSYEEAAKELGSDVLIPMTLGTVAYQFERAGLKGIGQAINNIPSSSKRALFSLINAGLKEGNTEFAQSVVESYNKGLGANNDLDAAREEAQNFIAQEGLETWLKGSVGGAGVSGLGRGIKAVNRAVHGRRNNLEDISDINFEIGKIVNTPAQSEADVKLLGDAKLSLEVQRDEMVKEPYRELVNVNKEGIDQINELNDQITQLHVEAVQAESSTTLTPEQIEVIVAEKDKQIANLTAQALGIINSADEGKVESDKERVDAVKEKRREETNAKDDNVNSTLAVKEAGEAEQEAIEREKEQDAQNPIETVDFNYQAGIADEISKLKDDITRVQKDKKIKKKERAEFVADIENQIKSLEELVPKPVERTGLPVSGIQDINQEIENLYEETLKEEALGGLVGKREDLNRELEDALKEDIAEETATPEQTPSVEEAPKLSLAEEFIKQLGDLPRIETIGIVQKAAYNEDGRRNNQSVDQIAEKTDVAPFQVRQVIQRFEIFKESGNANLREGEIVSIDQYNDIPQKRRNQIIKGAVKNLENGSSYMLFKTTRNKSPLHEINDKLTGLIKEAEKEEKAVARKFKKAKVDVNDAKNSFEKRKQEILDKLESSKEGSAAYKKAEEEGKALAAAVDAFSDLNQRKVRIAELREQVFDYMAIEDALKAEVDRRAPVKVQQPSAQEKPTPAPAQQQEVAKQETPKPKAKPKEKKAPVKKEAKPVVKKEEPKPKQAAAEVKKKEPETINELENEIFESKEFQKEYDELLKQELEYSRQIDGRELNEEELAELEYNLTDQLLFRFLQDDPRTEKIRKLEEANFRKQRALEKKLIRERRKELAKIATGKIEGYVTTKQLQDQLQKLTKKKGFHIDLTEAETTTKKGASLPGVGKTLYPAAQKNRDAIDLLQAFSDKYKNVKLKPNLKKPKTQKELDEIWKMKPLRLDRQGLYHIFGIYVSANKDIKKILHDEAIKDTPLSEVVQILSKKYKYQPQASIVDIKQGDLEALKKKALKGGKILGDYGNNEQATGKNQAESRGIERIAKKWNAEIRRPSQVDATDDQQRASYRDILKVYRGNYILAEKQHQDIYNKGLDVLSKSVDKLFKSPEKIQQFLIDNSHQIRALKGKSEQEIIYTAMAYATLPSGFFLKLDDGTTVGYSDSSRRKIDTPIHESAHAYKYKEEGKFDGMEVLDGTIWKDLEENRIFNDETSYGSIKPGSYSYKEEIFAGAIGKWNLIKQINPLRQATNDAERYLSRKLNEVIQTAEIKSKGEDDTGILFDYQAQEQADDRVRKEEEKARLKKRKQLINFLSLKGANYKASSPYKQSKITRDARNKMHALRKEFLGLENVTDLTIAEYAARASKIFREGREAQLDKRRQIETRRKIITADANTIVSQLEGVDNSINVNDVKATARENAEILKRIRRAGPLGFLANLINPTSMARFDGLVMRLLPKKGKAREEALKIVSSDLIRPLQEAEYFEHEYASNLKDNILGIKNKHQISDNKLSKITGIQVGKRELINDQVVDLYIFMADPRLHKSLIKGGITYEKMNEIADYMDANPELKAYALELPTAYEVFVPTINNKLDEHGYSGIDRQPIPSREFYEDPSVYEVLERIYGDAIPEYAPYIPMVSEGDKSTIELLEKEEQLKNYYTVMSGHLKQRTYAGTVDLSVSSTERAQRYADGPLRTVSYLDFAKNATAFFSAKNMRAMEATLGTVWADDTKDMLKRVISGRRGVSNDPKEIKRFERWLGRGAAGAIFANPGSFLLQYLSAGNFSLDNPVQYFKYMGKRKKVNEAFKIALNTGFIKLRGARNTDLIIQQLERQESGDAFFRFLDTLVQKGLIGTKLMDKLAITRGGAPWIAWRLDENRKLYPTEKEAIEQTKIEFVAKANEAQQTTQPSGLGRTLTTKYGKFVFQFQNAVVQFLQKMAASLREIQAGKNVLNNLYNLKYLMLFQIYGFAFFQQAMSNATGALWDSITGGFDDDEDRELTAEEKKARKQDEKKVERFWFSGVQSMLKARSLYGQGTALGLDLLINRKDIYNFDRDKFNYDAYSVILDKIVGNVPLVSTKLRPLSKVVKPDTKLYRQSTGLYDLSSSTTRVGAAAEFIFSFPTNNLQRVSGSINDLFAPDLSAYEKAQRLGGQTRYEIQKPLGSFKEFEKEQKKKNRKIERIE